MRDHPARIRGIAVKAMTDLVVYTAAPHIPERMLNHVQGFLLACSFPVAQKEKKVVRRREFRRLSKAPIYGVIALVQIVIGSVQCLLTSLTFGADGIHADKPGCDLICSRKNFGAPVSPQSPDFRDHLQKTDIAVSGLPGNVGGGKKRFFVRCHHDGERPTAAAVEHLANFHVKRIYIRALFAVDFDVDESVVEEGGDFFVPERFPLHDMAPMACGVADRQKNRFFLLSGFGKRFVPPRIPVHRVSRVLQQIGAFFIYQAI